MVHRPRGRLPIHILLACVALIMIVPGAALAMGHGGTAPSVQPLRLPQAVSHLAFPRMRPRATVIVDETDADKFVPQVITITVGDTVEWKNVGTVLSHYILSTAPTGVLNSGNMPPGATYFHAFTTAGTVQYECTYHVLLGMVGTVVVLAVSTPTDTPTATKSPTPTDTSTAITTPLPTANTPTANTPAASATPVASATPSATNAARTATIPAATATSMPFGATIVDETNADRFVPAVVTITVGQTVEWINTGVLPHFITSTTPAGILDSGNMNGGATYKHMFTAAGVYHYICVYHVTLGMVGSVVVLATSGATATPVPPTATPTATSAPATATMPPPTATTASGSLPSTGAPPTRAWAPGVMAAALVLLAAGLALRRWARQEPVAPA